MVDVSHDTMSLLSSDDRNYLIGNDGDQVQTDNLKGKTVGLYFSASWCPPCRMFTPVLREVYESLLSKGDFEVVFASSDRDQESFNVYLSKMPWLAIPLSDSGFIKHLKDLFRVRGIPNLVILDAEGKVLSDEGVRVVRAYGSDAYPFTPERISALDEEAKKKQTLRSLLVSGATDYLISNHGAKIPVSELEGKTVGLYFSINPKKSKSCQEFTQRLIEIYRNLKEAGSDNKFEIVLISLDMDSASSTEGFSEMPWLALPFSFNISMKLLNYFDLKSVPALVILGTEGKTLHQNAVALIEEHGSDAYPFTQEKLAQLAETHEKGKNNGGDDDTAG